MGRLTVVISLRYAPKDVYSRSTGVTTVSSAAAIVLAAFLPLQIQHCHQRLRHRTGPAVSQLHGILLGDHHMICPPGGVSQPGHVFVAVVMMIFPGGHLHCRAGCLGLRDKGIRIRYAGRRHHPFPCQARCRVAKTTDHTLNVLQTQMGDRDRSLDPGLQIGRQGEGRLRGSPLSGHDHRIGPLQGARDLRARAPQAMASGRRG